MDYNTNQNSAEIQTPKSSGTLVKISIILILLCVAIFYYFYHTQVLYRDTKTIEIAPTPITQEGIDAIIAIEPSSSPENALSQNSINSIIRAEASNRGDVQELSPEQISKLKQAN